MWTPRRVALLLAGIALFVGAFVAYDRLLGWLDGLPQLPSAMLRKVNGEVRPPTRTKTATQERLEEAFGPDCPEAMPPLAAGYYMKLEFLNGESSVVLACGAPQFGQDSKRVTVAPFSVAVFGKARPPHLRRPGEVTEITTFHSDKAIIEYDRVVENPNDLMNGKAKAVRLELVSEPDPDVTGPDPRRGLVHVTSNQRSADPNDFLVVRTPGPVFYRDPKGAAPAADGGPDIWTDAAVEVTDRQNLPRRFGAPAPPTAAASGDELRAPGAVADVLAGLRLPPPTVSAVGLRVYLEPPPKPGTPEAKAKKPAGGLGGARKVELLEKVLFNLWVGAKQGFVAAPAVGATTAPAALGPPDLPDAFAAVGGAGLHHVARDARRLDRALLQIETLGRFTYDVPKTTARFDVLPQADPQLPNDVQIARIPARAGRQRLFSQVLEVEFDGPVATPGAAPPADAKPTDAKPDDPAKKPAAGPGLKRLHAWAYSPGRIITVSSDEDRLEAYGQDLVHDQASGVTTLTGAPLHAVRGNAPRPDGKSAGGNVLSAGGPQRPAVLVLEPAPDPRPNDEKKLGEAKATMATVRGFGRLELFDPASGAATTQAVWETSLTQTKDLVDDHWVDVFTFTDGARFEDTKADYWLKGKVLRLWMAAAPKGPNPPPADAGRPTPRRLQALGEVTSHSAEFDIDGADQLNVLFRDQPPEVGPPLPPPAAEPPPPMNPPPAPGPMNPMPGAAPPPPKKDPPPPEPAKPKPPLRVRARLIDTLVERLPAAEPPRPPAKDGKEADADAAAPDPGTKYQLKTARCEGAVVVHQDPADPDKPRGVDITGRLLNIDHHPLGSVMRVTGTEADLAQVHHEGMSVIGPEVVIDQLRNRMTVKGRGSLVLPAGSDLAGREPEADPDPKAPKPKPPGEVLVHWRDAMEFDGADRFAEFNGRVQATQDESYVVCHTMRVIFDRPVSFNQFRSPGQRPADKTADARAAKAGPKAPKDDKPKVKEVQCYPAPGDEPGEMAGADTVTFNEVIRKPRGNPHGEIVKVQEVRARELMITARVRDPGSAEEYQRVEGTGPGTVRLWQPGEKDAAGPADAPKPPPKPGQPPAPAETEMKLTVVNFGGRMTMKDQGKVFQQAVFQDTIEVLHAASNNPRAALERARLPVGGVYLRCSDRLTVSTHRPSPPPARPGDPPAKEPPPKQDLVAVGNGYILSDDYEGQAETISSDGRLITLESGGAGLATLKKRYGADETPGRKIVYDRANKGVSVDGFQGGAFQAPGPPKKKK